MNAVGTLGAAPFCHPRGDLVEAADDAVAGVALTVLQIRLPIRSGQTIWSYFRRAACRHGRNRTARINAASRTGEVARRFFACDSDSANSRERP